MPTIQQLVRKGRVVLEEQKRDISRIGFMSPKTWCVCESLHDDS